MPTCLLILEHFDHLIVSDFAEIVIELTERPKRLRAMQADRIIAPAADFLQAIRRGHWYGNDEFVRFLSPNDLERRNHCGTCRDPVVGDNH